MLEPLKKIYEFNKQAEFIDNGYDDRKEPAYIIEEALEGFNLEYMSKQLGLPSYSSPKDVSRELIHSMAIVPEGGIADVDRFDKHLDTLVFTVGSMFKLGLNLSQIMRGLDIVMDANMTKLSAPVDEHGKQTKPSDFVSPEPLLQKILDERSL